MNDFNDIVDQDMRLAILRLLAQQDSYTASVSTLHRGLTASRQFHVSEDRVLGNVDWLRDQGLVLTEDLGRGVTMATAKPAGRAVAEGHATRHGITRYDPTQERW